ncbi:unnamed protein product, partial [Callosobruchus maculatus]
MRDLCKSSAVVAAVVAVLEKQNNNASSETDEKQRRFSSRHAAALRSTSPPAKFSGHQNQERSRDVNAAVAGSAFENAVKDFHSVAEDVEKICSGRQLRRVPHREYGPAASTGRVPQAPPRRSTQQQVKQVPQNRLTTEESAHSPIQTLGNSSETNDQQARNAPKVPQKPLVLQQSSSKLYENHFLKEELRYTEKRSQHSENSCSDSELTKRHLNGPKSIDSNNCKPQDINSGVSNNIDGQGHSKLRVTDATDTEQQAAALPNEFDVSGAGGTIFQIQQSGWSNSGRSGAIVKVSQVQQNHTRLAGYQSDRASNGKSSLIEDSRYRPLKVCDRAPGVSQAGVTVVQNDDEDDSTTPDPSSTDDSDEEREHVINEGLATIVEELGSLHSYGEKLKAVTVWRTVLNQLKSRVNKQSGVSSQTDMAMKELIKRFERLGADDDSSLEEEEEEGGRAASGSGGTVKKEESAADSSTRCNGDFRWISKQDQHPSSTSMASMASIEESGEPPPIVKPPLNACKPPIRPQRPAGSYQLSGSSGSLEKPPRIGLERPGGSLERSGTHLDKSARSSTLDRPGGSLDRRRQHHQNRQERDQRSRSSSHVIHVPTTPPPRLEDFTRCQGWCCNPQGNNQHDWCCFQKRHERLDPQRYGSNPALEHHRQPSRFSDYTGSHPDIYSDFSNGNGVTNHFNRHHEMAGCCPFHVPPPPCYCFEMPPHRGGSFKCWTPPPYSKV